MKPHEEWFFKAGNDLSSAEILLKAEKPLYDIAIYHAQQCAEKALKAYLAYSEREIGKIHNLIMLVALCTEIDSSFDGMKNDAVFLNPYSTLYRYPEGDLMPSLNELTAAIIAAKRIYEFVKNRII